MRQVFGSFLLVAVAACCVATAPAQDKKGPKEGSIVISQSAKDEKFRFSVRDGEGKFLAGSAAFATAKDAEKGVDSFKSVMAKAKATSVKKGGKPDKSPKEGSIAIAEGKDSKFRFTVRDGAGKFLAGSASFATAKDAEKGVQTTKTVAARAKVTTAKKKAGK